MIKICYKKIASSECDEKRSFFFLMKSWLNLPTLSFPVQSIKALNSFSLFQPFVTIKHKNVWSVTIRFSFCDLVFFSVTRILWTRMSRSKIIILVTTDSRSKVHVLKVLSWNGREKYTRKRKIYEEVSDERKHTSLAFIEAVTNHIEKKAFCSWDGRWKNEREYFQSSIPQSKKRFMCF